MKDRRRLRVDRASEEGGVRDVAGDGVHTWIVERRRRDDVDEREPFDRPLASVRRSKTTPSKQRVGQPAPEKP